MAFNTAIAQMMIYVNENFKEELLYRKVFEPFVLLLAPYAPHLAEEIWERLGREPSVSRQEWPEWIEEYTLEDEVTVVVQINGKVRSKIELPAGTEKGEMERKALEIDRIRELLDGKTVRKVITVPDKLVNIVAG